MTFNPNIPVNTDYMVISQPQIQSDFRQINSIFNENHVALNQTIPGNSQGMHDLMTFRTQPDPTTATDQLALYTKSSGADINLFFRPSNNQTPIQITYPSIKTGLQSTSPDVYFAEQYTFLAGPFVVYLGNVKVADGAIVTLLPATTLKYVGLTLLASSATNKQSAAATNIAANQFTVRFFATPDLQTVYYLAIGTP
jgi:hypothetical protein